MERMNLALIKNRRPLLRTTTQPSPILLVSFLVLDIYELIQWSTLPMGSNLHDRLVERIFHLALIIPSTSFVVNSS